MELNTSWIRKEAFSLASLSLSLWPTRLECALDQSREDKTNYCRRFDLCVAVRYPRLRFLSFSDSISRVNSSS